MLRMDSKIAMIGGIGVLVAGASCFLARRALVAGGRSLSRDHATEFDFSDVNKKYRAILVVKTGAGVGCRAHIQEEVVHASLVLQSGTDSGIKYSNDPCKPSAYHSSREVALEIAREMRKRGALKACGFDGPAIELVIPGIPFKQEDDTGVHMSIYNRPANAAEVEYSSPDLEAALTLQGMEVKFGTESEIKILNGSEANDIKTGLCYYVSISCDTSAYKAANHIRSQIGLPKDPTQKFHLSVAGIVPSWVPAHPKSSLAQSAGPAMLSRIAEDYKTFRHGEEQVEFAGFNNDLVTGWSSHAKVIAAWQKENAETRAQIATLTQDCHFATKKMELEKNIKDIRSLGFCKPVGPKEEVKSIQAPPEEVQACLVAMKKQG